VTTRSSSEACDRNYAAAFAALIPHVDTKYRERRAFGSVEAIATGLDIALYNPVFATRPDAERDLVNAIRWVLSLGVPASVQLAEELRGRFEPLLLEMGLKPDDWVTPGMALDPIPAPPPPPEALSIKQADQSVPLSCVSRPMALRESRPTKLK
jgi:hypothetical protein